MTVDFAKLLVKDEYRAVINPLNTGGLLHCCMLVESICHFRDVKSILSLLSYF